MIQFPHTAGAAWRLVQGDCLEVLRGMRAASVDAVVTDPPAGISFMGKAFDDFSGRWREFESIPEEWVSDYNNNTR